MTDNFMLQRALVRLDEAVRALGIATNHGSPEDAARCLASVESRVACYQHYLVQAKGDQPDGDTG